MEEKKKEDFLEVYLSTKSSSRHYKFVESILNELPPEIKTKITEEVCFLFHTGNGSIFPVTKLGKKVNIVVSDFGCYDEDEEWENPNSGEYAIDLSSHVLLNIGFYIQGWLDKYPKTESEREIFDKKVEKLLVSWGVDHLVRFPED